MSIILFEHKKAYESDMEMLAKTGKAVVIHPMGTDKSFIGFKYCVENPGKTVCWIAPREYFLKPSLKI